MWTPRFILHGISNPKVHTPYAMEPLFGKALIFTYISISINGSQDYNFLYSPPMVNLPQQQYDHDHDGLHNTWERYKKKGDRRQFWLSCLVHLVFSSQTFNHLALSVRDEGYSRNASWYIRFYSNSDGQQFHQKNNNLSLIEHKKITMTWRCKPKSWLGTCTNMTA